ncbi:UvrD-helicase domain-containing protein [Candidatus Acetothermia bacterium]|nr:UvrD-helicase domain-containing protein [Candidatus Acetothermia bacterium]MBI3460530.1 UvrD-helicase domain-containing protein [Candidatus Acetothermia bacterium]MBI3660295.1 UvrD-helicase domain-containing protein [Candidatus Acetothermia bacterium]
MSVEPILENLNPSQLVAVTHFEGPLLILAGAGSGKTRVITHRIAYLMAHYGIHASHILGVTFTNKAAEEMRTRVERLVGNQQAPLIRTFHSTCALLLREHIVHLAPTYTSDFTIRDEAEQRALITECMKELHLSPEDINPSLVAVMIDRAKDELIGPEDFVSRRGGSYDPTFIEMIDRLYKRYQRRLELSNAVDFADLIRLTVRLFQERLDILNHYRDRFKFLLIDEFQDTNYAQYIFARLLAEKYENICVVGDDDQAIFSWRGADPTHIFKFEKDFPKCKVVVLNQNYRSTGRILKAASSVIRNNSLRKPKDVEAVRETGERIYLYAARDEMEEADYIAREVTRLWKLENVPLDEMAILYRVNTLSRVLEEVLIRWQIPYDVVRGLKFYERLEIKDLIAYLQFLHNPSDDLSLLRILNKPRRGIGDKTVSTLQAQAHRLSTSLWETIQQMVQTSTLGSAATNRLKQFIELMNELKLKIATLKPHELAGEILNKTGYLVELQNQGLEAEERLGNIKEFLGHLEDFSARNGGGLREFLEHIALVSEADNYEEIEARLSLMTLHSAKGLEFGVIFLVGMEENLLPHSRSVREGTIEEERRLCYVGITRAKEKLYVTFTNQRSLYGSILFNSPSRFIWELPREDLEVPQPWALSRFGAESE